MQEGQGVLHWLILQGEVDMGSVLSLLTKGGCCDQPLPRRVMAMRRHILQGAHQRRGALGGRVN